MDFKTVKLGGKEYPIIFSAWVIDQIQEKSDDVEAELNRILDSSKVKDMLWLLSLFLRGGYEGAKKIKTDPVLSFVGEDAFFSDGGVWDQISAAKKKLALKALC